MMTLKQYGLECGYEMGVFMRMYFGKDESAETETHFSAQEDSARCVCLINRAGTVYEAEKRIDIKPFYDDDIIKKAYKNTVVGSFCLAAEKIRSVPRPWGVMSGIRPAKNVRVLLKRYSPEEVRQILRDVYGVSEEKIQLAFEVCRNEKKIVDSLDQNSVGLYIGIPFCPTRCSYCSFISSPVKVSGKYIPEYVNLLVREIEKTADIMEGLGVYPESIYIGGGTPTTLSAAELEKIFSALDIFKPKEMTLEAGRPDTVSEDRLECAAAHGVNRISVNPQTMHLRTLERIGRMHTPEDIFTAFEKVRKYGFRTVNMDLIAGLPGENCDMFRESLDTVCGFGSENITVHTMCIKRAADIAKNSSYSADAEDVDKMLAYSRARLDGCGYIPYYMYRQKNIAGNLENVGYTKPGHEGLYNIRIMEEIQTIIALGGGGSSKLVLGDDRTENGVRIERVFNFKDAAEYVKHFDEILLRKEKIFDILKKREKM